MTLHAEEEMDNDNLSIFDVERGILTGKIIELTVSNQRPATVIVVVILRRKSMRVRPAKPKDLAACGELDHSYTTDRVWQMDTREWNESLTITFRVARLPREMRVAYPLQGEGLLAGWRRRDGFLVAEEEGSVCGYVTLTTYVEHGIAWVGDLVVDRPWRRRGVGTSLLQAAAQWGYDHDMARLVIEVQTKNYPAIRFCQSRGLILCGYNDQHWPNQDIALFFGESLR